MAEHLLSYLLYSLIRFFEGGLYFQFENFKISTLLYLIYVVSVIIYVSYLLLDLSHHIFVSYLLSDLWFFSWEEEGGAGVSPRGTVPLFILLSQCWPPWQQCAAPPTGQQAQWPVPGFSPLAFSCLLICALARTVLPNPWSLRLCVFVWVSFLF